MHASHWLVGSSSRQPRPLIGPYVCNARTDPNVQVINCDVWGQNLRRWWVVKTGHQINDIPKYCKISLTPSASINNISIFPYFDNWMRSTCRCSGHVFWRRRINQGPSSIRRHAGIGQRTRRTHTLDTAAVSTQLVLPHGETWYLENVGSLEPGTV